MINFCILSISAILVLAAEAPVDRQSLVFNLDAPQKFEESLSRSVLAPRSSRLLLASIEGPASLKVIKGADSIRLEVSLVTLDEPVTERCSFTLTSEPMTRSEAKLAGSKLLEMVGSDRESLDAWLADDSRGKRNFEKRIVGKKQTVSLLIRKSSRDDTQLTITLAVGFDRSP